MKYFIVFALLGVTTLTILSCGGGGGGSSVDLGQSPHISNLVIKTENSATLNQGLGVTYVGGTLDFNDTDGDVVQLWLSTSTGQNVSMALVPGPVTGTVEAYYEIPTIMPGVFTYNLWVEDSKGNSSNVLSGEFTVTEDLDYAYGQNGIIMVDDNASGLDEEFLGSTLQSDGKIVVAGRKYNGLNDDVFVQRYTGNGALDTAFADNGTFIFDSGNHEKIFAVGVQSDGKIVLAGYIKEHNAGNDNILLIRLNTDGTYDVTFGGDGIVTTNVSDYGEYAYALAIAESAKIIIAGEVSIDGTDIQALVVQYNSDGTLDNSFGTAGVVTYDGVGWDVGHGVAAYPNGKVVLTGSTSAAYPDVALTDLLVVRFNSDGSLDNTFGVNGTVTYDSIYELGNAVLVQDDGKVVVGGTRWSYASIENAALMLRYNSNGSLDSGFGSNGVVMYQKAYGFPSISGNALGITDEGKVVFAGFVNTDGFVIRVENNGTLDQAFSVDGISAVVSGGYGKLNAVEVQSDGTIIVSGSSTYHDGYSDHAGFLAKLKGI